MQRFIEHAAKDSRIMLVTGDLGYGVVTEFAETYPDQFVNAGVAEQNMTGLATGLALDGRIVFTYSIANFPILRCLEQVRNDSAYHDANVKIIAIGGGFSYGALGVSHHATEDLAILRALPGVTVVAPCCEWETQEATTALIETPGTCYMRLDRCGANDTSRPGELFEIGRARTVRDGSDVALLCTGAILEVALEAADSLNEHDVSVRVISVHTLKPVDRKTILQAARDTQAVLTVEEHVVEGGLGGAVAEICLEGGVPPRAFYRIGLRGGFADIIGSQDYLRQRYGLDARAIETKVLELLRT